MATVALDSKVPDFTAASTAGEPFSLKDARGDKLVLYFYPKDATPGCTTEGENFRDLHARFRRAGTQIFGVSRDTLSSHDKFRSKMKFPFHLLSDTDEVLCRLFDVIHEKNMYGRKMLGVVRSTFLIDSKGVLRREWRKVQVTGHAEEVLEAARSVD
ncbi:MAG: peroxiredoxin [Pseudomonadota bacterium]